MAVPDVALTPAALTSPEDLPAHVMTDMKETAQPATVNNRLLCWALKSKVTNNSAV